MGTAHTAPIALLAFVLGYLALLGWIVVEFVRRLFGRTKPDSLKALRAPIVLVIAGALMASLPLIPAALVGTAFVTLCGPGKGSGSFAYMAIQGDSATLLTTVIDRGGSVVEMSKITPAPLDFAAALGRTELVKILLDHGADVNAQHSVGYTALMNAVDNKHIEVVRLLLRAGASPHLKNIQGKSALDLAIEGRNQDIVDELRRASSTSVPRGSG